MAKQQNTYAKRSREMEKKRKADQKRERRAQRKQEASAPSEPAPDVEQNAETSGEAN
jgi:hypothetical protein